MDWCRRKSLFLLMIFFEPFRNPLQIIGFPMWGNPSIYLIMDLSRLSWLCQQMGGIPPPYPPSSTSVPFICSGS